MSVMWNLFSLRLEIVLVSVQDRSIVCAKCPVDSEIVLDTLDGTHWWRGSSKCSVHSEIVLILTQDRRTVCIERTIGLEIILDAPDGTPGDVGDVESHFFPFGDSVSIVTR
jgi:hypothetical protein